MIAPILDKTAGNADQGSAYTFASTGAAARTETAKLTASGGAFGNQLGPSVAIDGDTILAGATGADSDRQLEYDPQHRGRSRRGYLCARSTYCAGGPSPASTGADSGGRHYRKEGSLTFLVEGEPREAAAFKQRYQVPTVGQIDPSFIHMHPAVMERSDFDALEEYSEPVEPRVIEAFDYRRQVELTAELAEELVDTIFNRLDHQETVHDRVFEIMRSKRFRAGTVKQTRFEDNRELFRPLVERHVEAGTPLELVMPSFPFKHRNPVKVGRRSPDMAEVLCLCRLREASLALRRVHEPGARFVVVSDGLVYRTLEDD